MTSHLLKNGAVLCDLILSDEQSFPATRERRWQCCSVMAPVRVVAGPTDLFAIAINETESIPFLVYRRSVAANGWIIDGKAMF